MVNIRGVPLLSHIADAYNSVGIKDIVVVRGYKKEAVNLPNLHYIDNDEYADTGELYSLAKGLQGKSSRPQDTIISYGDVLFNTYIPQALLQTKDDFVIFVDSDWKDKNSYNRLGGFAECTAPNTRRAFNAQIHLTQLGTSIDPDKIHGVWMGFLKVSASGLASLQEVLSDMLKNPANEKATMGSLLEDMLKRGYSIRVLYTVGHWLDINSLDDVVQAGSF